MKTLLSLLTLVSLFACQVFATSKTTQADLLIYSGSPAGVMSAVAAARNGMSVIVVDMNSHIGGVMAGGLMDSDVGEASTISGLSKEFFNRVEAYYIQKYGQGSREHTLSRGGYHFEPSVAEHIFREMLAEQNVIVWEKHRFLSLTRNEKGDITSVTMENPSDNSTRTFTANYFVDASYEGDLMAAAGVPWTYGREAHTEYNESLAGIGADPDKSKIGTADHRTMSYNYRMTLTNKAGNTIPFYKPEHYDPAPFEKDYLAIKTAIKRGDRKRFVDLFANGDKRANPNEKYDANWADHPDSSEYYAVSDWPTRDKIAARIRNRSQSLLYWYASNPEFPQEFRDDVAKWGYPKDEYTDNKHFPFQLYVREARRMIGLHVLTQQDITETRFHPDGIAVGSYGIDCKVVRFVKMDGNPRVLDNTRHYVPAPYDIPYGVLCPPDKPGQPANLLVPLCCSASHVAYCSLRMEPVYMMLGHASGTAIALAHKQKIALQKLDPQQIRAQLRKEKAQLDGNYLPLVAIEHSPETPMPSEEVTFSIKILHPLRDPIKKVSWDLTGDGTVAATTARVSHTFSQGKIYNISLYVEDEAGRRRMVTMPLSVGDAEASDIVMDDADPQLGKGQITGRMGAIAPRGEYTNRFVFTGPGFLRSRYRTKASIRYDVAEVPPGRYRLVHSQPADKKHVSQASLTLAITGEAEQSFTLNQRESDSPFPFVPITEFSIPQKTSLSVTLTSPSNDGYLVSDGIRLLYLGPIAPAVAAKSRAQGRLAPISHDINPGKYYGIFEDRPLTEIRPEGWLRQFLQRHREGLGTHYAESGFPFSSNFWIGLIEPAAWSRYEQTAFLLDGVHRAAVIMGDQEWQKVGRANIEDVLNHPQADGKLGKTPAEMNLTKESGFSPAQWPFAVFSRAIMSEYDATKNPRILEALTRHYLALSDDIGQYARDAANVEGMIWLYSKTKDPRILKKAIDTYNNFEKINHSRTREKLLAKGPIMGHGAVNAEMIVIPVNLYLYTGEKTLLEATEAAIEVLNRDHLLPSYTISSSEEVSGHDPEHVHELCAQVDHTWILQKLLLATGKVAYADQIEKSVYNAGFGSLSKDFKSHQYFSAPNQAISTQTSSNIVKFGAGNLNRQAYRPGHTVQCCSGSVHRVLANLAGQLWVAGEAHSIVAAFYAPGTLSTKLADGTAIKIYEYTNYPFEGRIDFEIEMEKLAAVTLRLRIPEWAENASLSINGETQEAPKPGTFHTITRNFKSGDRITLTLPLEPKIIRTQTNDLAVLRGPLLYSAKIKEHAIARSDLKQTSKDYPAWDLTPESPWNYALNPADESKIKTIIHPRPRDSFPWDLASTPVTLTIPARRVENWTLTEDGKNPPMPKGDLKLSPNAEEIELVPYGATRLRWTVFPEAK